MHKNITKIFMLCLVLIASVLSQSIFAQKALPSGTEIVAEINSDTTSAGERVNSFYTMERGGVYFTLGTIQSDYDLTIKATGDVNLADPLVIILVDESNNYSTPFKPFGNLTLEGISINGVSSIGTQVSYIVEAGVTGIKISLKNCDIDSVRTAAVRVNYNDCSVFLEDCSIQNVAGGSHTGRVLDARETVMDTISLVNNTFYNVMHDIVGRFSGGQKLFKFDHNTVFNLMRCPLRIDVSPEIIVTNNLFLQTGFVGVYPANEALFQVDDMGNRDEWVRVEIWPLDSVGVFQGMTQNVNFKNNNWWVDPTVEAAFPDTITAYRTLDFQFVKEMISDDTLTWISENVNFTNAPNCDYLAMAATCWVDGSPQTNPGFSDKNSPFDFTYSTTSASYTAAEGGFPLGDLNWFPEIKAQWLVTDVKDNKVTGEIPSSYSLTQNYPNPFNPNTTISYSLPTASDVKLKIYNTIGQEVAILINTIQKAGTYNVDFNASSLSSGIYFYSISTGDFHSTKKMILLK